MFLIQKIRVCLMSGVAGGLLLQSGSCSFDTQQFVSTSLFEMATNSSTLLVTSVLSEWLKVTPSFGF